MINCTDGSTLPPPSNDHIEKIQSYYEIVFPKDYRLLLTLANGCTPTQKVFSIGGNEKIVERFLPVLDDAKADQINGWADIEVVASQLDSRLATDPNGKNIDLIPIASLFAGDFIVLDYRLSRNNPSIGLWDHEASDEFSPSVRTIATSVTEFIEMLRE